MRTFTVSMVVAVCPLFPPATFVRPHDAKPARYADNVRRNFHWPPRGRPFLGVPSSHRRPAGERGVRKRVRSATSPSLQFLTKLNSQGR